MQACANINYVYVNLLAIFQICLLSHVSNSQLLLTYHLTLCLVAMSCHSHSLYGISFIVSLAFMVLEHRRIIIVNVSHMLYNFCVLIFWHVERILQFLSYIFMRTQRSSHTDSEWPIWRFVVVIKLPFNSQWRICGSGTASSIFRLCCVATFRHAWHAPTNFGSDYCCRMPWHLLDTGLAATITLTLQWLGC